MLARLRPVWELLTTSLWFVPGLLIVGAGLAAWLAVTTPIDPSGDDAPLWWLHSGSADDAATLLSSLLTSMITMATLAVSITMVVLALAAGQLGPRLIRSFMADKRTQVMLGFLLATIVYLVLVLRIVSDGTRENNVPHLAVTLGTALVLICVGVLLLFVHHLARSIVADTVIDRVGRALDRAIDNMLPDADPAIRDTQPPPTTGRTGAPVSLRRGGYVQAITYSGLVNCAHQAEARIALYFRPGQHLLPGGCHGHVEPASAFDEAMEKQIAEAIIIGAQRTAAQDLEFAIRQLVEVALRALSPGVNDPYTAIAVIDRLGLALAHIMACGTATGVWLDDEGVVRVTGETSTFRGLVEEAFNQIRQAGAGSPAILIRIQATLARLAEHARHQDHRSVLGAHVDLIAAAGRRSIAESHDLMALEKRTASARSRLTGGRAGAGESCSDR